MSRRPWPWSDTHLHEVAHAVVAASCAVPVGSIEVGHIPDARARGRIRHSRLSGGVGAQVEAAIAVAPRVVGQLVVGRPIVEGPDSDLRVIARLGQADIDIAFDIAHRALSQNLPELWVVAEAVAAHDGHLDGAALDAALGGVQLVRVDELRGADPRERAHTRKAHQGRADGH